MEKGKAKKKPKNTESKKLTKGKSIAEVVRIMANTPPISNKAIVKRSKKSQK